MRRAAADRHRSMPEATESAGAMESRPIPERICVRQGGEYVVLMPGMPTLSSAQSPWEGALLERHAQGPHSPGRHQHMSHFVCLQLSDPAAFDCQSGSVFVMSRGTEHSVSFPKPAKRIFLNLEPNLLQQAFAENDRGRDVELINQPGVRDPQVEHILRALEADLEAGLPGGRLFGESLLCAIAIRLQRSYGVFPPRDPKLGNGLPRVRLKRVIEYIEANLEREIALTALAEIAGMSPHYFCELFKRSVRFSPHQYVLRQRIARAQDLLIDPRVTVLEAAVRSGFSDQSHFTKIFRRIVGVTPTAYRAAL
jgi:AraC family transcriptional regulator